MRMQWFAYKKGYEVQQGSSDEISFSIKMISFIALVERHGNFELLRSWHVFACSGASAL